jgi:hypothetical protein
MRGKSPALRKSVCTFVAVFVLAAAVSTWWLLNRAADEPHHRGHPLSYWVQQYEPATDAGPYMPFRLSRESAAAVREIGTNALPTMLQWMTRPEKGLKSKIVSWANDDRIPFFARRLLVPAYPKLYRPDLAILAFRALGTDARSAVPSLAQMLHAPNNARWAVMALCAVGPEGATALEEAFPWIGDGILRANIISQLEHGITPELEQHCAAFLAQRLGEDSHAGVRMSAARVLGMLSNSPAVAVPALTKALQDRDGGVRFTASTSLGQFGSAATTAIVSLQAALNDANPQVRLDAARALRSIQGSDGTTDEEPE